MLFFFFTFSSVEKPGLETGGLMGNRHRLRDSRVPKLAGEVLTRAACLGSSLMLAQT